MPIKSPFDIPKLQFELQKLAFIALGSNLGDSRQNVLRAAGRLQEFSDFPLLRSSFWQTTPVDCPPGSPPFVNSVVGLLPRVNETPETLIEKLQSLEAEFGREPKKVTNEPRPLDLDLIAFRQETRVSERLTLPHPRAHLRRFVLQPLSEIASDLVLPGQVLNVRQLLETLDSPEKVSLLA
jgi:2-amino-4-hydroxy-6-hydroxymethyldihydropteridine diphosphokinase